MRRLLLPLLCSAALAAQQDPITARDGIVGAGHWAFAPISPPAADPLDPTSIDRLVDAARADAGIPAAGRADRRTLLRRATFALTGLPPTAEEVAAFCADEAPDAFERAVDRLLASPHYGEHQARAWLDLARYSDSNGLDENLAYGEAFRYRDWVVRACNEDLPFDRFGTMQLAGDVLAAREGAAGGAGLDGHVATAFLALGPKMLAEQDKEKLVLDVVDEQVDLVGRTFLGLTLGCARCHDHKFDPVPTRDYYALAGIFKSTKVFENLDHVSRWLERELADDAAIARRKAAEAALAAAKQRRVEATTAAVRCVRERLARDLGPAMLAAQRAVDVATFVEAEDATTTSLRRDDRQWGNADCTVLHSHQGGPQFAQWTVRATAGRHRVFVRYAAQESRPMRVLVDGREQIGRALAATTGGWLPEHQAWYAAGEVTLHEGENAIRIEAIGPHVPHLDCLFVVPLEGDDGARRSNWPLGRSADEPPLLGEVVLRIAHSLARGPAPAVLQPWRELARVDEASFAARAGELQGCGGAFAHLLAGIAPTSLRELAGRYATLFSLTREGSSPARENDGNAAADVAAAHALVHGKGGWLALPDDALRTLVLGDEAERLRALDEAVAAAEAEVPPRAPLAMCVAEGEPVDLPVHVRGSHLALAAESVPRGFLSVLDGVPKPAIPAGASGRLQLARWIFDPRNPLPARVLANRVWLQLFGQGLVRSPSNFGLRGDRPSHPDLLDLLATSLLEDGWSVKRLQRRILLSATWQRAATFLPEAALRDPENRLLWRSVPRRLPAESVRDAMLAVAGTLDRTIGGSLLSTKNRAYVTNDQSNDAARYDAPRRSLYLPIIRNAMYDLFTAFDYADPSVHLEQRPASTVAAQALLLLNSPFVLQQAEAFAALAARVDGDADARTTWIWQRALQRDPTAAERAAARRWHAAAAQRGADGPLAWQGLCQALFCSNEFAYVD